MAAHNEEIAAIVGNPDAPTFENTFLALDVSGEQLGRVQNVFFVLTSSDTNENLQKIQAEISPRLSKHYNDISLNQTLFDRIKAVYEQRESLELNDEQRYLVGRVYKDFVRGGAALEESAKQRLNEINQEITRLAVNFGQNLLKENNAFELVLENEEDLAGLPDFLEGRSAGRRIPAGPRRQVRIHAHPFFHDAVPAVFHPPGPARKDPYRLDQARR